MQKEKINLIVPGIDEELPILSKNKNFTRIIFYQIMKQLRYAIINGSFIIFV